MSYQQRKIPQFGTESKWEYVICRLLSRRWLTWASFCTNSGMAYLKYPTLAPEICPKCSRFGRHSVYRHLFHWTGSNFLAFTALMMKNGRKKQFALQKAYVGASIKYIFAFSAVDVVRPPKLSIVFTSHIIVMLPKRATNEEIVWRSSAEMIWVWNLMRWISSWTRARLHGWICAVWYNATNGTRAIYSRPETYMQMGIYGNMSYMLYNRTITIHI